MRGTLTTHRPLTLALSPPVRLPIQVYRRRRMPYGRGEGTRVTFVSQIATFLMHPSINTDSKSRFPLRGITLTNASLHQSIVGLPLLAPSYAEGMKRIVACPPPVLRGG